MAPDLIYDVGSNNGTTTIGKGVRVTGAVVGRTIELRQNAVPDSLFCLLLKGGSSTLMGVLPRRPPTGQVDSRFATTRLAI